MGKTKQQEKHYGGFGSDKGCDVPYGGLSLQWSCSVPSDSDSDRKLLVSSCNYNYKNNELISGKVVHEVDDNKFANAIRSCTTAHKDDFLNESDVSQFQDFEPFCKVSSGGWINGGHMSYLFKKGRGDKFLDCVIEEITPPNHICNITSSGSSES